MRHFSRAASRRAVSRVLSEPARRQSGALGVDRVVSVRSKGYGPSVDLIRGAGPHSQVVLETHLHPNDVEVQRSVLSLTMPSLANVVVVNTPDHSRYRTSPLVAPMVGGLSSGADPRSCASSLSGAALEARIDMLEISLEVQMATVANLIMEQVCQRTGAQFTELEVRQSSEAQSLANTIIGCLRHEICNATAAAGSSQPSMDADKISRRISEQVAAAMQQTLTATTAGAGDGGAEAATESLECKIDSYFGRLQESLAAQSRRAADGGGSDAAAEMCTAVVDAVNQAANVQRESLLSVLEDLVASSQAGGRDDAEIDTKALEEFIEGSLNVATDDIRHSIAAEVKKALKGHKSVDAKGVEVDSLEALEELGDRLDAAAVSTKRTLNSVEAVQETVSEVQEEQRRATELLASIKTLLQQSIAASAEAAATATAAVAAAAAASAVARQVTAPVAAPVPMVNVEAPIRAAVSELQQSLANLSARMDVKGETMDRQLMDMAQAISESVLAAVETRTGEAVAAALSTIDAQVQTITHAQIPEVAAPPPIASVGLATEDLAAAIESILAPKLEEVISHIQQAILPQQDQQVALAQSISDAVVAALSAKDSSFFSPPSPSPSPAAASPSPEDDGGAKLAEKLEAFRAELVATVEAEMGKTHDVNLTPMYQYVDSMLTFLKDELSAQEGSLDRKISEATAQLAALITRERAAEPSKLATHADLEQMTERLEAAIASATAAIEHGVSSSVTAVTAMTSNATTSSTEAAAAQVADPKLIEQMDAIQTSLQTLTVAQQVTAKESIDRIVAGSEERASKVTLSLVGIEETLRAQAAAMEALSPAAQAKRATAATSTAERVIELTKLRTSTAQHSETVTTIMQSVETARSPAERAWLLQSLRVELTALNSLRQEEEAHLASITAPEALEHSAEAAAAAAPVKRELSQLATRLESQLSVANKEQSNIHEEVATAIRAISGEVQTAAAQSADLPRLVSDRIEALEKLMTTQQRASAEKITRDISASTTTMIKESASTQVSSVVERITGHTESQVLSKLAEGFATQAEAVKTVVAESAARAAEAAVTPKNVDAIAAETTKRVEQLMAAALEKSNADAAAAAALAAAARPATVAKARVPLWWLLAYPFLVCLTILACAYYLFACFLVAFVPAPDSVAGSPSGSADPSGSGGPALSPTDTRDSSGRGRRVVDRVL